MPNRPTIERCSIDYANDDLPAITHGKVTFLGDRAVLWEWNAAKGKHDQIDSLSQITTSSPGRGDGGRVTITGTSTLFREHMGVDQADAQVTVVATPTPAVVPA
jgi:hypothetical protein